MTTTERPILFSGPMVRAILAGTKTVTRRVITPQPPDWCERAGWSCFTPPGHASFRGMYQGQDTAEKFIRCPYEQGHRLWVRETWAYVPATAYRCSTGVEQTLNPSDPDMAAVYAADWTRCAPGTWRPSIHMPRWASRLTLEIVGVRVERLQEISTWDAEAEGVNPMDFPDIRSGSETQFQACFRVLWDKLNSKRGFPWESNPWVWRIEFRRLK